MKRKFLISRTSVKKEDRPETQRKAVAIINAGNTRHAVAFGYDINTPKDMVRLANENKSKEIIFDGHTDAQTSLLIAQIERQCPGKFKFFVLRKTIQGAITLENLAEVLLYAPAPEKEEVLVESDAA